MKKNFLKIALPFFITSSLFAVYDPVVAPGWTLSQQRQAKNHCFDTVAGTQSWAETLPTAEMRDNFCSCVSEQYLHRFTFKEFNTIWLIAFRKAGIKNGKYDKPAIQTAEQARIAEKVKIEDYKAVKYCARPEIIEKQIRERRLKYIEETQSKEYLDEFKEAIIIQDESYLEHLNDFPEEFEEK